MIYTLLHVSARVSDLQGDSRTRNSGYPRVKTYKFKTLWKVTVIYKYVLKLLSVRINNDVFVCSTFVCKRVIAIVFDFKIGHVPTANCRCLLCSTPRCPIRVETCRRVYHHHHYHHHVQERLGVFPVRWSSKRSWSFHLFLGRPMFLRPFGLYCSACFGILFVSILCTCCNHFCWYCLISFTMFCTPSFSLIVWFFSLSNFVIPSKCLKNFICAAS
jgi:hypothetical protein